MSRTVTNVSNGGECPWCGAGVWLWWVSMKSVGVWLLWAFLTLVSLTMVWCVSLTLVSVFDFGECLRLSLWHGGCLWFSLWHGECLRLSLWHGECLQLSLWHGECLWFSLWHGVSDSNVSLFGVSGDAVSLDYKCLKMSLEMVSVSDYSPLQWSNSDDDACLWQWQMSLAMSGVSDTDKCP